MTMILIKNIKEYCQDKKNTLKEKIKNLDCLPILAVIQVGDVEASTRYIKNKKKDCEEVGIKCEWYWYEDTITTKELICEITDLMPYVDGLIVQTPLPDHIDVEAVKLAITPEKDVDGFHPQSLFEPCAPAGIVHYLLEGCGYDFAGKNVTIFGKSDIVGKPLAKMLTNLDATVTLCHSKTRNIWDHIDTADLIVTAIGKAGFLNCYAIHVPVIDVGINFDKNGKLVGDCINTENRDVTPVPGGVGLLTRVQLLENVVLAAEIGRTGTA